MIFQIKGRLPGLNEYVDACRGNRYAANSLKQNTEELIMYQNPKKLPSYERVNIHFTWVEPNRRRDKDNIAFAKKFVLDALVKSGKLKNDGWQNVINFSDSFKVDNRKPGVIVEIKELTNE